MHLNKTTFDYLQPTAKQLEVMQQLRQAAAVYGQALAELLPDGPDKGWTIRLHRTTAMWANVAATRTADGTPRRDSQSVASSLPEREQVKQ
jgi:hypothetical protein